MREYTGTKYRMGSQTNSRAHRNISVIASTVCSPSPGAGSRREPSVMSNEQCLGSKIVVLLEAEESFLALLDFIWVPELGPDFPRPSLRRNFWKDHSNNAQSLCPSSVQSEFHDMI